MELEDPPLPLPLKVRLVGPVAVLDAHRPPLTLTHVSGSTGSEYESLGLRLAESHERL